ncbi:hypothetical protein [Nocardiopsis sp. NPDC055824]
MQQPPKRDVYPIIQALGRAIWEGTETPAGLLVVLSNDGVDGTDEVVEALRACGYTVTKIGTRRVIVGGVDPLALLDAQIAALTAQRDALAATSIWRCKACSTYSPGDQDCIVCGYSRDGRAPQTITA